MRFSPVIVHLTLALAAAFTPLAVGVSSGQMVPNYDFQWVTIGDPGNRGVNVSEVPNRPELAEQNLGAVGYEYRMARTEVTVRQWFEFVRAYDPYHDGPANDTAFAGASIEGFGGVWNIMLPPELWDLPTLMSWEYAARYCNWLHNGKALTREAFETGVYDTSTFTRNPDGTYNHQRQRSADARFWIPTLDEWTKAAHWDPSKNDDEGGYWRYPGGSDVPLIPGTPESGAQTNAGPGIPPLARRVGSYPNVNAPWGLLDTSGGVPEWTSSTFNPIANSGRSIRGAGIGDSNSELIEQIDFISSSGFALPSAGLRLASVVPAPHSAAVFGVFVGGLAFRRTRPCSGSSSWCSRSTWRASSTPR